MHTTVKESLQWDSGQPIMAVRIRSNWNQPAFMYYPMPNVKTHLTILRMMICARQRINKIEMIRVRYDHRIQRFQFMYSKQWLEQIFDIFVWLVVSGWFGWSNHFINFSWLFGWHCERWHLLWWSLSGKMSTCFTLQRMGSICCRRY